MLWADHELVKRRHEGGHREEHDSPVQAARGRDQGPVSQEYGDGIERVPQWTASQAILFFQILAAETFNHTLF